MIIKIFLLFLISFGVSESLFSEPDLSNTDIPLRSRQLCGYRYRPNRQKISHNNKCFMHSFEDEMVFNPLMNATRNEGTPTTRVLHGVNAEYREAPWSVQLALSIDGAFYFHCTGVLITHSQVMTAAHCYSPPPDLYVFIGSDTPFSGFSTNKFEFFSHPNYVQTVGNVTHKYENDIAIIALDKPIVFAYYQFLEKNYLTKHFIINTICLPLLEEWILEDNPYEWATFFGWGLKANNILPKWLQRADLEVRYEEGYLDRFMSRPDVYPQTCPGDSGAGLVQYLDEERTRAVLIGILSTSVDRNNTESSCSRNHIRQTIFVRVSNHLKWISERLRADIYIEEILESEEYGEYIEGILEK